MHIKEVFPNLRGAKDVPPKQDLREPHNTKTGPGRKHLQGDGKSQTSKQKKAGAYGRGLRNHFNRITAQKSAQRIAKRKARLEIPQ